MATNIARQDISNHVKGNTFRGIQYTLTDENDAAIDLTNAAIRIQFRKNKKTGDLALTLTTNDHITLTDASNGVFSIDNDFEIDIPAGLYYYDILFIFNSTTYRTYVWGEFTVLQNVTEEY